MGSDNKYLDTDLTDEELDDLELLEMLAEALAARERGDVISHEEVKRRLGYIEPEESNATD